MRNLLTGASALALLMAMPDAGGGGGPSASEVDQGAAAQSMSLVDAVNSLDPEVDGNWTADGLPDVDVIESLTGNKWISRGDIDGIPIDREAARDRVAAAEVIVAGTSEDQPAAVGPAPTADPATIDPATAPPKNPAPATPPISQGRIVLLTFDAGAMFDGGISAVGLVVKVLDDGSINVKAFSPDGGSDGFFTGVRNADDVAAMADGADKNSALACTWSWPPRV